MNIEELKAVVDVSRFRNFAEAAQYESVSPAIISKYVSKVESELGVAIFERATKSKPVELTPAGKLVIRDIKNIINDYSSLLASVQTINDTEVTRLSIGHTPSLDKIREERIIADFIYKNPTLTVKMVSGGIDKLFSCLMSNVADAIFLRLSEWDFEPGSAIAGRILNPSLEIVEIRSQRSLYLLMNKNNPLSVKKQITMEDIGKVRESTLLLNSRSTYVNDEDNRNRAFAIFNGQEQFKCIKMDEDNQNVVLEMMRQHDDLILPVCAFDYPVVSGLVSVPVKEWNVSTRLILVYRKNNNAKALRKFIAAISEN